MGIMPLSKGNLPMCRMCNPESIEQFVKGGKSTFTISSVVTGSRYTYRVSQICNGDKRYDKWLVSLLTGPDNISSFTYLGMINNEGNGRKDELILTSKSKMTLESKPVRAFVFLCQKVLQKKQNPENVGLEFRHMNKCGRCNRPLTLCRNQSISVLALIVPNILGLVKKSGDVIFTSPLSSIIDISYNQNIF